MDSLTQATLGAAIGEAVLGKQLGRKGAVLGAIIATIPDLDVLLYVFYDSLTMLSVHRGFSHSILCCFLLSIMLALLLKKTSWTKEITTQRLFAFVWLCLFTHVLLDAFTAYGTQLFLPFSNERFGFDSINVVDPFYTVPMLIGLFCTLFLFKNKPSKTHYNTAGLIISTSYLLATLAIKNHVNHQFEIEFKNKNIAYNALLTMPVGIGGNNWYAVAKQEKGLYLCKYSVLKNEFGSSDYFPIHEELLDNVPSQLATTMRWFAKGFYTIDKAGEELHFYNLQVDMGGVVHKGNLYAPTLGYFKLIPKADGTYSFSSGSHR